MVGAEMTDRDDYPAWRMTKECAADLRAAAMHLTAHLNDESENISNWPWVSRDLMDLLVKCERMIRIAEFSAESFIDVDRRFRRTAP